MAEQLSNGAATIYKWTDNDTRQLISWRTANASLFTGRRNAAVTGYEAYITAQGLEGRVTPAFLKKKWENLKQKYKDLKCPRSGVSTEGGETTAASWKWYSLLDEAIGDKPSVTPPVLIASSSQDVAVVTPPSELTPEPNTSMTPTPKRRRVDVMEVVRELQEKEKELEEKERERDEVKAREAAEREEREERRHREAMERDETRHREAMEREERRHREAMEREERREREAMEREERRERDQARRDEMFVMLLNKLVNK